MNILYGQLLHYTELYNCSQPAAGLVSFDVNNSCRAALSYFDKGHCYWMPLIVDGNSDNRATSVQLPIELQAGTELGN